MLNCKENMVHINCIFTACRAEQITLQLQSSAVELNTVDCSKVNSLFL